MKPATNPRRFALLLVTAVGLLITGCDCGRRPWPRTQVRLNQPNRASTGAASTSKAAEVTVTAHPSSFMETSGVAGWGCLTERLAGGPWWRDDLQRRSSP
jgi:hypothetical protein